jgi:hypothetical protein
MHNKRIAETTTKPKIESEKLLRNLRGVGGDLTSPTAAVLFTCASLRSRWLNPSSFSVINFGISNAVVKAMLMAWKDACTSATSGRSDVVGL